MFDSCLRLAIACVWAADPPDSPAPTKLAKLDVASVPNVVVIHSKVASGGQPDGEAGFRELARRGFKTLVSVDGAVPDVKAAARFGLRYVHLPHGYDGIAPERVKELAKALRELPGPIYVHCHHGKHRSPAAAACACIAAGLVDKSVGPAILELAGTGKQYRGLFAAVAKASVADPKTLDDMQVQFRAVTPLPATAAAMVELESRFDRLQRIAEAGWKTPAEAPDLDPPHEALIFREHYTEMIRAADKDRRPEAYRKLLRDGEALGLELTALLSKPASTKPAAAAPKAVLQKLGANCTACHARFRDDGATPAPAPRS